MPPEPQTQTQGQPFDYLGDMKKRYPGLSGKSDQDIWKYLGQPENFRKVYPKYKDLDDYTIEYNVGRLSKGAPKTQASKGGAAPAPAAPAPTVTPKTAVAPPQAAPQPTHADMIKQQAESASQQIESWKPQWADPRNIMKDPTWYGRSGRYFGGETVGLTKSGAQVMVGGAKLVYDVANALDPLEAYKHGQQWGSVGEDVIGLGKGVGQGLQSINDVLKTGWDVITGHPELHADPIKFGEAVGNAAMTVDGAIKLSEGLAAGLIKREMAKTGVKSTAEFQGQGADAMKVVKAQEAAKAAKANAVEAKNVAAKIKANPTTSALFRKRALGSTYIDQTPIQMGRDLKGPYDAVKREIDTQAKSLSDQIDKKYPQGSINADDVKNNLLQGLKEEVATPKLKTAPRGATKPTVVRDPIVNQMLLQAKAVAPGMWTFEQVRQLREMVGRSMQYLEGPEKKVVTQAYIDLTNRLAGTAKKAGLEKTWNQYNGLSREFYQNYENIVDDIKHANSGKDIFNILRRDPALTSRMAHSFARYGLDYDKFMQRFNRGNRILKVEDAGNRTMFYYANRLRGGLGATIALRVAGAPGYEATMAGFALGVASNYVADTVRALALTGDMNWHIYNEMLLRGKMPKETAIFPEGEEPGPVPPEGTPPSPGTPPTGPQAPPAPVPGGTPPAPEAAAAAKAAEPPPAKPPKATPPKPAGKTSYAGPERRTTQRTITQDLWAKNQIDYAREQLAKATDESEKNVLRRRIEELQKDPTLAGGGEELGRDISAVREGGKPSEISEKQAKDSLMGDPEKAKAYDAADQRTKDSMIVKERNRMRDAGVKPITKVAEGVSGKKIKAKKATATEPAQPASPAQQKYDRERVAAKRQEKGPTAYGGGGKEITGGGAGSAAIEQQEAARAQAASTAPNTQNWTAEECIQYLKTQYPDGLESIQNILRDAKKGKSKITAEEILSGLRHYATIGLEENAAKARADALIKEQEGRPLSESEKAIQKSLEVAPKPTELVTKGRWYRDPGAIPGEPLEYLDATKDDLDGARAVIIETDQARLKYKVHFEDGSTSNIGFETIEEARKYAENFIDKMQKKAK